MHPSLNKKLLIGATGVCILGLVGYFIHVQFTAVTLNFVYFALAYLAACFVLWQAFRLKWRWLRIGILSAGLLPILLGLMLATVGILGLGFIVGDIEPDQQVPLTNDLTLRAYKIGNAISDYRGLRVEVYDKVDVFPLLEHRIFEKQYYSMVPYAENPTVELITEGGKRSVRLTAKWREESFEDVFSLE